MSIEDQIHIIGITIGWTIFACYLWSVSDYFVKLLFRKKINAMPQASTFRKRYIKFMQAVVKSHIYVPLFMLTIMFLHLMLELIHIGFFITGVITFALMLLQIGLGIYGAYVKGKKKGPWFYAHRVVAAMLFVAIVIHVTIVIIVNP